MTASGSEIEREFGFGVVRRLFDPLLRSLGPDERAGLFAGPAALAAAIFGLAGSTTLDVNPAEASLYGLFWLAVALAEKGPLVLAIDDAHWADVASLRFLHYLGRRLDGLPLLLCVAGRPAEPGPQAAILDELAAEPGTVIDHRRRCSATTRPRRWSTSGSAAMPRPRSATPATRRPAATRC